MLDSYGIACIDQIGQLVTIDDRYDITAMTETHLSRDIANNDIILPINCFKKTETVKGRGVSWYVSMTA